MKLTKSKQFLADAIHASGNGWPNGADFAAQDKDMWTCLYDGKPTRRGNAWKEEGDCLYRLGFYNDKLSPNWHQTVLSCEEYFSAYPAESADDADGWIEWKGGNRPAGADDLVDVKYANGTLESGFGAGGYAWNWKGDGLRIIAYRPHKSDVKPELCESVMRSIPEPPTKPTIEQLAADYRNAKGYAERKQQEADAAKADAEAKLAELVEAGKALSIDVMPISAKQGTELVITDWRDLRVGDIVLVDAYDDHAEGEWPVSQVEDSSYDCDYAFSVKTGGSCQRWVSVAKPWRFIRRP
jgi:hypothetical protein